MSRYFDIFGFILNKAYVVGWSVEFFFLGQNRSSNQRSGMILEVQIQNFGAGACALKLSFWKNPGGLNINNFCETSFYIEEQMQKNWKEMDY